MDPKKIAQAAARWWGERLKRPRFQGETREDKMRGANTGMDMAEILATLNSANTDRSDDKVDAFVEALAAEIENRLKTSGNYGFSFGVDYHPDAILLDALSKAGFSGADTMSILPWKTSMWVKPTGVKVSEGYGSSTVEVPVE